VTAVTKASTIADELRLAIARGEIVQGARLFQDELAQQFSTSITPVREALRQLEAEKLLEGEPHRGVKVTFPGIERVESLYVLRRQVETFAAMRAALRLSRRDLLVAGKLNDQLAEALEGDDPLEARRLNHDFHFVIYEGCEMPTLIEEIERLWSAYPWSQMIGKRSESVAEHAQILAAVAENDQARIERNVRLHLQGGYETVARQIEGTVRDPFDFGITDG
jgi:DNA-binding GntR family transcriptional regulator